VNFLRAEKVDIYPLVVLFKKEFISFIILPIFPLLLIVTILASSLSLLANNYWLNARISDLKSYFLSIPILFSILIPLLTMNVWADEKKENTKMFLLSLPISHRHIVYAKYLANLIVALIMSALTLLPPLSIIELLQFSFSNFFLSFFSITIFVSSALAISQAISFASRHGSINFLISFFILLILNIVHIPAHLFYKWNALQNLLSFFSFYVHFENASKGIFDSRDILFYTALLIFGLELNILLLRYDKA